MLACPAQRAAQSGSGSGVVVVVVFVVVIGFAVVVGVGVLVVVVVCTVVVAVDDVDGVSVAVDVDIVVVVVVILVVDVVGCAPSQHVSSDLHVLGFTHVFAETQNKSPFTSQNSSYPVPPEHQQYWSVQQAFDI